MFFNIAPDQDTRFPAQYRISANLWLNCDHGWQQIHTSHGMVYVKGYCHEHDFDQHFATQLILDPVPRYTGSFIAVLCANDHVVLTNDTCRASPIWHDWQKKQLGNMAVDGDHVWADAWIEIDSMGTMVQHRWPAVPHTFRRPLDQVIDRIHSLLLAKFAWLAKSPDKIKVFFSGGIDTLLCISYLQALHIPHELITAEHFDYDQFTLEFDTQLKANWGYTQIHHWRDPCVLVTGACGDEYFLRGPATANIMLSHLGTSMCQVLQASDYHYKYFSGLEKSAMFQRQLADQEIQQAIKSHADTCDYILRMCINDHQHWHLGHTLTFTPFKDIQILNLMLGIESTQDLIACVTDAKIQKMLIAKNNAQLLQYLCTHKNQDRTAIYKLPQYLALT